MILKTSFMQDDDESSSPVSKLVDYLNKSEGLQNRCGCEMDETDKQRFLDSTRSCDMGRLFTFSPDDDLTDKELSQATRSTMSDYLSGKYSTDYVMAIHRDTDQPHTQVAVAGNDEDLHMDRDDIEELQQQSLEQFQEQEIGLVQMQLDGRELNDDVAEEHTSSLTISRLDDQWTSQNLKQTEIDASRSRRRSQ